MKIYFNSDFIITKREYEEYFLGSEYHNKIEVYFPMTTYGNYTYIYPVFNVKRPDNRKFGEFALTEYNVENDYIVWSADLPAKALEVEGTLEITIIFKYSTDNKYAKVSTGKVLLNVKEAVIGEENDVIFTGSGDNLQDEIDAIRNEFGVRFNNVETRFISDLAELDNYTTPGLYKFNLNNTNTFHLFVIQPTSSLIEQTRSSRKGYYTRTIYNGVADGWKYYSYNVNGVVEYDSSISYVKGAIVNNDGDLYLSLQNNNNTPLTSAWKKLDFASFVNRFELSGFVPKEEGKGLSSNDLTDSLLAKLNALNNYDDTAINNKITAIERILVSDNVDLDTLQEIVDVLEENEGDINAIFTAIAKKVDKDGLKTINGESIVGDGDIVIKGGSGNAVDLSNYYDIPTTNALLAVKEDKANLKSLAYRDSLNKADVGLGNVNNTSDLNKPISTATQAALNNKVDTTTLDNYYTNTEVDSKINNVVKIAEGKTNSYVLKWFNNPSFESNEDVIEINLKDNPILDYRGATVPNTALKIGDIFYIIETNVPDRWLAGINRDVYMFAKMETSKVDLDSYATDTDVDNKIAAAIGNALEADY